MTTSKFDRVTLNGVDITPSVIAVDINPDNYIQWDDGVSEPQTIEGVVGVRIPSTARIETTAGTAYLFDEEESRLLLAAGNEWPEMALALLRANPRDPV